MDKIKLEDTITELLLKTFIPKLLTEGPESPSLILVRSGIRREVTENIMRLVEDFYEGEVKTAREQETPDAVKTHDNMVKIVESFESWKRGNLSEHSLASNVYSFLADNEWID